MKNCNSLIAVIAVLTVIFMLSSAVGCSNGGNRFDVSGQTTDGNSENNLYVTTEDIKNLVTDDEKIVINYYNAYIWVVYYNEFGKIDYMTYIYDFADKEEAEKMADARKSELEQNKTMTVNNCYIVDNYLVVDLIDTSFTNVSRSILEYNFNGLIVY